MPLAAIAFDMDGVLIDSEPLWQEAIIESFHAVGLDLDVDECRQTMGFRVDEAIEHWERARGWDGTPAHTVIRSVVDGVLARIATRGTAMPGAIEAVHRCSARGLGLAVATSSWPEVADAVLERLDLTTSFAVVCSAAQEARGKPSPDVYLTACRALGHPPSHVLAIEDSLHGVAAALAAGMRVVAVPDAGIHDAAALTSATVLLGSLLELDDALLDLLAHD